MSGRRGKKVRVKSPQKASNKEDQNEEVMEMQVESEAKQASKRKNKTERVTSTQKRARENRRELRKKEKEDKRQTLDESFEGVTTPVQMGEQELNADSEGENNTTAVVFQDDDNLVTMRVDSSEFPSEDEERLGPSSEEESGAESDGQILDDEEFGEVAMQPSEQPNPPNQEDRREFIYVRNPEFQGEKQQCLDQEDRIVLKTVAKIQELMAQGGYFNQGQFVSTNNSNIEVDSEINFNLNANANRAARNLAGEVPRNQNKVNNLKDLGNNPIRGNGSEVTLYKTVVQPQKDRNEKKQMENNEKMSLSRSCSSGCGLSSSDEDQANTSDEMQEQIALFLNSIRNVPFADKERSTNQQQDVAEPSTSDGRGRRTTSPAPTIHQCVDNLLRDAENVKARINDVQGRNDELNNFSRGNQGNQFDSGCERVFDLQNHYVHSAMVDEDYLVVAAHVDESVNRRIRNGEYVDFSRLLPHDRVTAEFESQKMQLITMQNGNLACTPTNDTGSILSFAKWEQAFRVFSNIYTREFPQRASELIQYNHVIHTAAITYAWSNIYSYDIDFRTSNAFMVGYFTAGLERET